MGSKKTIAHTFIDWMPGEPANYNHDENRVCIWHSYGYKWGDIQCEERLHYICEA